MKKSGELLLWVAALTLGVALLATYRFNDQDTRQWVAANPNCNLQLQACTTTLSTGEELTLAVTPRPIYPLKPLQFEVVLAGATANQLWLEISGVSMEMGMTRVLMTVLNDGRYRGEGMLPICSMAHMEWRVRIVVITPTGGFSAPFRLETTQG